MQRTINNKSTKAYCKVCHDAGKSEKEYTSHFTRETPDKNAKVTCPTLLALECRYCHKNGHTIKYCTVLKENQFNNPKQDNKKQINNKKEEKKEIKNKNRFELLDSNENEEMIEEKEDTYPKLVPQANENSNFKGLNFLEAIKKEAPVMKPLSIAITKEPNTWEAMDSDSEEEQEYWEEEDSHVWDNDGFDEDWEEEYERPVGKPAPWANSQVAYFINTW